MVLFKKINETFKFPPFAVPRAEPDDPAPLPRARRRRAGVRAGAQVPGSGADALPRAQALHRGAPASVPNQRIAVSKGFDSGRRLCAEPNEIVAAAGGRRLFRAEFREKRERDRVRVSAVVCGESERFILDL